MHCHSRKLTLQQFLSSKKFDIVCREMLRLGYKYIYRPSLACSTNGHEQPAGVKRKKAKNSGCESRRQTLTREYSE